MHAPPHTVLLGVMSVAIGVAQPLFAQVTESEMRSLESKLPRAAETRIDFNEHIRPIFATSCLRCHGLEKPKGEFRLDDRAAALKGGEHGVAIVPGESARSPLIYYVAGLVADMEMPPPGKDKPLNQEQIALLRAWIDQNVAWPQADASSVSFSVTPSIQWFRVSGDKRKFREHTGILEGGNGGLESLLLEQQLTPDRQLSLEARVFPNAEDYRLRLQITQRDYGFARFGFEQYREYYDDTGGYYPHLSPPSLGLNRNLYLDLGRAYVDFGLTLPDWPRMVVGYEFQYRDGTKSLLQWGDVGTIEPQLNPRTTDAKKIFPGSRRIDEQIHIFKFELDHEAGGVGIENRFRAELYDNQTERRTTGFLDLSNARRNREFRIQEGHDHFQASDSFTLQKQLLDWLFLSGGYHYGHLDGQYELTVQPRFPDGPFPSADPYYFAEAIILEQDTHTFNANAQLGPWSGLTIYGGAQSEWMSQRGIGDVRLDEGSPRGFGGIPLRPVFLDSNLDRVSFEENFGARFTGLPHTVLFLEGRATQESIGQTEARTGTGAEFLRDTDTTGELHEGRIGFTVSPWTRVSLTAHFKHREREWDYEHLIDRDEWRGDFGYSAFILDQRSDLDEISAKLSVRPANWIKVGLTYQFVSIDSRHTTLPIPETGSFVRGGTIHSYDHDAHVYSANVALTPWRRIYLNSAFSYRRSRSWTGHDFYPTVVDYEGNLYSTISSATYVLNDKTDMTASYSYSWADYGQKNDPAGLPLGMVYDWQTISAGVTRRFKKNISTNLQYRFYQYAEGNSDGVNNYTAHGVLASLTMSLY